ncbi:sigma-70 family RNA polymerase sigma factor [Streptomyces sp. NPDC059122]|uniref:sigma-70 family RNA polymerase sigma factor n=1 Tax=unclassified Streptomyces TaxID=2593676 RepID=UPI00367CB66D
MASPWRVRRRTASPVHQEPRSLQTECEVQEAYDRYGGELFGFAFKALGNRQLAEDVVQEVFVRAWRSSFDPSKASLRTWLFAIARNAVADALRKRLAQYTVDLDAGDWDAPAGGQTRLDPMDQLLERIQLEEALARLSPEHREAVVKVYFGGQTCAELGRELGVSASTMRSRLYYGVRTLRLVLEENGWLAP